MPLQDALAEIDRLKPGSKLSYQALAKKHGCCRSTLTRRHRGQMIPHQEEALQRRLLHPRDEVEVVEYIRALTKRHLMPTRQMITNFLTPLCSWEPSERWITRFLNRHADVLLNAWSTPMEATRHHTNSGERYQLYFELLHSKMAEYDVLPENICSTQKEAESWCCRWW